MLEVSVIITTYCRKVEILERAVKSVLCQDYQDLEIIVVNDAPDDVKLSKDIGIMLKNLQDRRIRYCVLKKHGGACKARNVGIHHAKGKYIAFLDDDDEWLGTKLSTQMKYFVEEDIGLVYCSYYLVYNPHRKAVIRKAKRNIEENAFEKMLEANYIGSTSFPIIKKQCFETCGCFDERLPSSQDWDMWLKIVRQYKVAFCEEPLVKYYVGEASITSDIKKRVKGWEWIIWKYRKDYKKYPQSKIECYNVIERELFDKGHYVIAKVYAIRRKIFIYKMIITNTY